MSWQKRKSGDHSVIEYKIKGASIQKFLNIPKLSSDQGYLFMLISQK